jgi:ferredoxin-NADP reductase/anaerobic selenocysteine-containing dehydrogenase
MQTHPCGLPEGSTTAPRHISCSYCGVGDGAQITLQTEQAAENEPLPEGPVSLTVRMDGRKQSYNAVVARGEVAVQPPGPTVTPGGVLACELLVNGSSPRAVELLYREAGIFTLAQRPGAQRERLIEPLPTKGCVKFTHSMVRQTTPYPIHLAPSVLDPATGTRRTISYGEAIDRLADLLLAHREAASRTLLYASGQVDYFTIFATQEVFRLLGVRNLTGNAEHCLNAGAVHNEILTGQEGPFLTLQQCVEGPGRFFIFNGWNGLITHPPGFAQLSRRADFDAVLIEVMETETARFIEKKLGAERVLLIRPGSDPHLALAVAHELITRHQALDTAFHERHADAASLAQYRALAESEAYDPARVAERIAPEPALVERLRNGIALIARRLADPTYVPVNLPSVGLSQSSGVVAHCLWGSALALVGKYGLKTRGTPAGGTLRLPGQINAETEVQGLSRKYFMGRVKMDDAAEAAVRMGLPADAYQRATQDTPRAALDYSDPTPDEKELFVCMGTQFEANMMGRQRWLAKLRAPGVSLVVIDPIPDTYSLQHAALIIPSPPHPATTKLYQNGEWKLTLSLPQKVAALETRSDPTILYDVIARIGEKISESAALAERNADLVRHLPYIAERFGRGLPRQNGEVNRAHLWTRIQSYFSGGRGPLYCRPEHEDGRPIEWLDLLERGSAYYGGVGTSRFQLDAPDPFRDIYRQPTRFKFFTPTTADLALPTGIILNSGRSSLSDDRDRIAWATATFNSGKGTPAAGMPDEHPLHVSPSLAARHKLHTGDRVRVIASGGEVELPVQVSSRVKGDSVYASFHKSHAQMDRGVSVNDAVDHLPRCAYSAQTRVKVASVRLERVAPALPETTRIDPKQELPIWNGTVAPLTVTAIIRETHDVFTYRMQSDPLCRFAYWPGQFCTIALQINGKRVLRSYSISSTPTRPYALEITVKRVEGGLVSNWLADNMRPGSKLEVVGPKGHFCLEPSRIAPKLLLIGAGSGITPVMSMARYLADVSAATDVRLLSCVRGSDDLVYAAELALLQLRQPGFSHTHVASRPDARWSGPSGRLNGDLLRELVPDFAERTVYMCGPDGFMASTRELLESLGLGSTRIHQESFGGVRAAPLEPVALEGDGYRIDFARSARNARMRQHKPLLEVAEDAGIDLPYSCRSGSCGECKVKLLKGGTKTIAEPLGITAEEREQGWLLTCVCVPTADCVLDA